MSYYIQDAISQRTRESSFIAFFPALPHLDWDLISADMQRRNCLETLGDAVMSLSITNLLQKLLPDRSLQVYSVSDIFPSLPSASSRIPMIQAIRPPLVSNQTFQHILANAGVYNGHPQTKCKEAGNAFEIYVGAFSETEGFDAANAWIAELFAPLVYAAIDAYDLHFSRPPMATICAALPSKRPRDDDQLFQDSGPCKRRRGNSYGSASTIPSRLDEIDVADCRPTHRTPAVTHSAVPREYPVDGTTKYERRDDRLVIKILADKNFALGKLRQSPISQQEPITPSWDDFASQLTSGFERNR